MNDRPCVGKECLMAEKEVKLFSNNFHGCCFCAGQFAARAVAHVDHDNGVRSRVEEVPT